MRFAISIRRFEKHLAFERRHPRQELLDEMDGKRARYRADEAMFEELERILNRGGKMARSADLPKVRTRVN